MIANWEFELAADWKRKTMSKSVATQGLLRKRATSIAPEPSSSNLERLAAQLRSSFPEYRRQSKQEFLQRLEDLLLPEAEKDSTEKITESSDEEESKSDASKGNDEDIQVIDEAISEFVASEGTEKINKSLRNLYGLETSSMTAAKQPTVPVPSSKTSMSRTESGTTISNPRLTGKRLHVSHSHDSGGKRKKSPEVLEEKKTNDKERKQINGNGAVHAAFTKSFMTIPRPLKYSDLGGLEEIVHEIKELVEYPLKHPEVYEWLGVEPPKGVLLHGPPGCGKTALAHAIARECQVPFFRVSAPEIVSGMSGESEGKIRSLFTEALNSVPSIIFIDEIDAIAAKRENAQREMERRIVAQMLTCMDDLSSPQVDTKETADSIAAEEKHQRDEKEAPGSSSGAKKHVIVLGATNRPEVLDPALRRAGRFDREISLGIPTESSRIKILSVMCSKLKLEGEFDFSFIARKTPGFVGADLEALTREAAAIAVTRIFSELQNAPATLQGDSMETDCCEPRYGAGPLSDRELAELRITMDDFVAALSKVQPSLGREGFTTKPDVTWADIGSLKDVWEELSFTICQPILHPEKFERMGLSLASGVLLFGPPGCGKTLVAKAVANEAGTNFISIKGPELLNKYVGESERAVRQLFARARAAKPCVLFFDEMDALAPKRGSDNNQAAERLVNQLLTEMDGMDSRQGVYLIAATNRPDIIDPALLRPGRLDKILYVPLPDSAGRASILKTLAHKTSISEDVDFDRLASDARCRGLSGADLAALVREACIVALKENLRDVDETEAIATRKVQVRHFNVALQSMKPSVSEADAASYNRMKLTLRQSRSHDAY